MGKAYLLTGEPGIGKTTALKKVLDGVGREHCGGFYTEAMCAAGQIYGYRVVTLDGRGGVLADVAYYSSLKVGKLGVILEFLDHTGLAAISHALSSKSFVVIEIGPMELCSPLFKLVVRDVLTSSVPLIGTIFSGSDPWSDEIKRQSDVALYELTMENRNEVPKTLIETLRDI